jgi:dihydrofolate synthase/folylpolyglutamate synthase
MHYATSLRYLNSFLNHERIIYHPENRHWNLDRMRLLLDWFGQPATSFFPILIAGTKGKGSTGFFLESILTASNISAGFYCSPHLEDPRERIRIDGKIISKPRWIEGMTQIRRILAKKSLPSGYGDFTYFEIMTLLAILVFQQEGLEIGIFEVGMGGRLDATNVLDAKIAVLTPIHLDHEAFLGDTVTQIAREKAAIIRSGSDVVVSPQKEAAMKVIRQEIKKNKAHPWWVSPVEDLKLGLTGEYQKVNAGAACAAAKLLRNHYAYAVSEEAIKKGLQARDWPGRFELLEGKPQFLLDGAHNPSSIEAFVSHLTRVFRKRRRLLIFGSSRDKKSYRMLQALSTFFHDIILVPIPNPRSQEVGILLAQSKGLFRRIFPTSSVSEGLTVAKKLAGPGTLVTVTGSFYLVGEAREILRSRKSYA